MQNAKVTCVGKPFLIPPGGSDHTLLRVPAASTHPFQGPWSSVCMLLACELLWDGARPPPGRPCRPSA